MQAHFRDIDRLYDKASVYIPNSVFRSLSTSIKNKKGGTNIQQTSFAYAYIVTISFLYKYASFVSIDNNSYIQNSDIKELLGYGRGTKTIDKVIKKNGVLDNLGLTRTTKDYPVIVVENPQEDINGIPIREYSLFSDLTDNDIQYNMIKSIVKNRNYEIKEPLFLTHSYDDNDYGTLYNFERTHEITLHEFLRFVFDNNLDNIDFLIYAFIKSRCKGYKMNKKSMAIYKIVSEIGIDRGTFYDHLEKLKKENFIKVNHKEWEMKGDEYKNMEANEYIWKGV